MKILLIGGTGNISSEVTPLLIRQGHDVTILTSGVRPVPFDNVTHIKVNKFDCLAFKESLQSRKFDVTIDFMSFTAPQCAHVFDSLGDGIGHYIFISSAVIYRKGSNPIIEETIVGNDNWDYAQGKIDCENWLNSIKIKDFPVTIVRPSHTIGKTWIPSPFSGEDFTVANRILYEKPFIIHDKGESLWTLTAASDFAKGLCGLIGNQAAMGETFHITSDEYLTWNEIYTELAKALGAVAARPVYIPTSSIVSMFPDTLGKLRGDKAEDVYFDNSKIKKFVPQFKCEKSAADILQESVEWYMGDPIRRRVNDEEDARITALIDSLGLVT